MSIPQKLRKLDLTTTKDYAVGDTRQIPAQAAVTVYKQGVTYVSGGPVNTSATNVTLTVRDTGRVVVGDTLVRESDIIAGTAVPPTVTIDTVTLAEGTGAASVRVDHTSGGNMTLTAGDRLICTSNKPSLFSDSTGNVSAGGNPVNSDATTGYLGIYVQERFVDVKVAIAGYASQVFRDMASGEAGSFRVATDYGGYTGAAIQAAINDCPAGGAVYCPAGRYAVASEIVISKPINLYGDNAGDDVENSDYDSGTILYSSDGDVNVIRIADKNITNVTIRDLKIDGGAYAADPGEKDSYGIICEASATSALNRPALCVFENLHIRNCGKDGMHLRAMNWPIILNCNIIDNAECGIQLNIGTYSGAGGCIHANIQSCHIAGNLYQGVYAETSGATRIYSCGIESNCGAAAQTTYNGQVELKTSDNSSVLNCGFEFWWQYDRRTGNRDKLIQRALVIYDSHNPWVEGNFFAETTSGGSPTYRASSTSISLYASSHMGGHIGTNFHEFVETAIECDNSSAGDNLYGLVIQEQCGRNYAATPPTHATWMKIPVGAAMDGMRQVVHFGGLKVPVYDVTGSFPSNSGGLFEGCLVYCRNDDKLYVGTVNSWAAQT